MTLPIHDARVIAAVDLLRGPGQRVVAVAEDDSLHTFSVRPSASAVQQAEISFSQAGAFRLALQVLAGSETAMTAPHTLRTLAAALVGEHALAAEPAEPVLTIEGA